MKKNILITGGSGFIGGHTSSALLEKGYSVRILDNLDPQIHGPDATLPEYMDKRVEFIRGDVRNPEDVERALQGMDAVYHFAALTGVGQSMYDLRNYTDVTVTGTACLLETIMKERQKPDPAFDIQRFVLASSRATYGEGTARCPQHGILYPEIRDSRELREGRFDLHCPECGQVLEPVPTEEDRPLKPASVYAWTKQQQEHLCRYAADKFGLSTIILRYFNVYGPHQSLLNPYTGVVSIFFSRLRAGRPISIYEFNKPLRDMVYISDVVDANVRALEAKIEPGTPVNVGSGTAVTIREVADALARALGEAPTIELTGEYRVGDILQCVADLHRAERLLGYTPRVGLEEGMRHFVQWARNEPSVDRYQQTVDEMKAFNLFGRAHAGKES